MKGYWRLNSLNINKIPIKKVIKLIEVNIVKLSLLKLSSANNIDNAKKYIPPSFS